MSPGGRLPFASAAMTSSGKSERSSGFPEILRLSSFIEPFASVILYLGTAAAVSREDRSKVTFSPLTLRTSPANRDILNLSGESTLNSYNGDQLRSGLRQEAVTVPFEGDTQI